MRNIKWHNKPWGVEGWVFFTDHLGRTGEYRLTAQRRPAYCDRGDWQMLVDSRGASSPIDQADGFPRYFFGDIAGVKAQFAAWVAKRKECALPNDPLTIKASIHNVIKEAKTNPDPDADEALNRIVQSAAERIEHGLSYEGASSIEGIVRAAIKAARKHEKA